MITYKDNSENASRSWLWLAGSMFFMIPALEQCACFDDVQKSSEASTPFWLMICGCGTEMMLGLWQLIGHFGIEPDFNAMLSKQSTLERICRGAFYACRDLVTNHRPDLLFQKQQLDVVDRQVSMKPIPSAWKRRTVLPQGMDELADSLGRNQEWGLGYPEASHMHVTYMQAYLFSNF